jgi:hypothetical protein
VGALGFGEEFFGVFFVVFIAANTSVADTPSHLTAIKPELAISACKARIAAVY